MRGPVFMVVLSICLLPGGQAGTAEDPEIQDDAGDVRWLPTDAPFPTGHDDVFDILATWFHDETPETISITMHVQDLGAVEDFGGAQSATGFARWGTRFELTNYEEDSRDNWWNYTWIVGVDYNNGPAGWRGSVYTPDRDGEQGETVDVDFDVDMEASTLTVVVPRDALGSPQRGDRMFDTLSLHDGEIGGIDFRDQAPGGTYPSRDYVFVMNGTEAVRGPVAPIVAGSEANTTDAPEEASGNTTGGASGRDAPAPALAWTMATLLLFSRRRGRKRT